MSNPLEPADGILGCVSAAPAFNALPILWWSEVVTGIQELCCRSTGAPGCGSSFVAASGLLEIRAVLPRLVGPGVLELLTVACGRQDAGALLAAASGFWGWVWIVLLTLPRPVESGIL